MALKKTKKNLQQYSDRYTANQVKEEKQELYSEENRMDALNTSAVIEDNQEYQELNVVTDEVISKENPQLNKYAQAREDLKRINKLGIISFKQNSVKITRQPMVEEADYFFVIKNIEFTDQVETVKGKKDQIKFYIDLTNSKTEEKHDFSINYNIATHPDSAVMQFLSGFSVIFHGRDIHIEELIGLEGICRIHHLKYENGNIYEKLEILNVNTPN